MDLLLILTNNLILLLQLCLKIIKSCLCASKLIIMGKSTRILSLVRHTPFLIIVKLLIIWILIFKFFLIVILLVTSPHC